MKKTVQEIMKMINDGDLHFDQSTQRKFVYADLSAQLEYGSTTKAGSLINSILEKNIQLPAVYFWHNTDTNHLNIHDGKQRLLSIFYFIQPTVNINVTTIIKGKSTSYTGLSQELKDKLLNYTFDIVERTGTSLEEEESFDLINSNSVPLTQYECIRGMFYGPWLDDFESYIDQMAKSMDNLKPINRGEQAFKILLTCFNIKNDKQASSNSIAALRVKDCLRPVRQNRFNASDYRLTEILKAFNEIMHIINGIKEERALALANFIIRNNYNKDIVLDNLYRPTVRNINDIKSWDMETHKTFIKVFIEKGVKLDGQRWFTKDQKDELYRKDGQCAYVDPLTGKRCTERNYNKLEVDHKTPWSLGGRTTLDNGQLLCKNHNASKGNRI